MEMIKKNFYYFVRLLEGVNLQAALCGMQPHTHGTDVESHERRPGDEVGVSHPNLVPQKIRSLWLCK